MDWYLTPIFLGLYMSKKNLEWDENSIQKKKQQIDLPKLIK